MRRRMDFFASLGCCVSDHALEYVMYSPASDAQIERIFADRLAGKLPDRADCDRFYTAFMLFVGEEYSRRGWVMAAALRRQARQQYRYVRASGSGYRLRLREQLRAVGAAGGLFERAGAGRPSAKNDPLQFEHQRQRRHRFRHRLLPEFRRCGENPARLSMVVQRLHSGHHRADGLVGESQAICRALLVC